MSRFKKRIRDQFPNMVAAHFDKYCEFINPVEFDPLADVYRPHWPDPEWEAYDLLSKSQFKAQVSKSHSFDLYLPGNESRPSYDRSHVTFYFPKKVRYPDLDIEFDTIPPEAKDKIRPWLSKGVALKKLRAELYNRCNALLDFGWRDNVNWYDGGWRGAPTPGQGCNTMGQVDRIWPEITVYFPAEHIATVRHANVKSRLPKYIRGFGTPAQFTCEERPCHKYWYDEDDDGNWKLEQDEPFTDEEWVFAKRKYEAINTILTQMSLLKDVRHVEGYPELSVR